MNLKKLIHYFLVALLFGTVGASCKKENTDSKPIALNHSRVEYASTTTCNPSGVYLLYNDVTLQLCKKCGAYGGDVMEAFSNNTNLSYFDFSTKKTTTNSFPLSAYNDGGSYIQNAKIYGSKMYVVYSTYMTGSLYKIEILNTATKAFVKQIQLTANGINLVPIDVAFYKKYALVITSQKLLAVIDTATMVVARYIKLENQANSMLIANGKLFILCSDSPIINVYDLASQTYIQSIYVTPNPYKMGIDGNGNIYVLAGGLLDVGDQGTDVIDSKTYKVLHHYPNFLYYNMWISNDDIYYLTEENKIEVYNAQSYTLISSDMLAAYPQIGQPYDIHFDNSTGNIFVYSIVTDYLLTDGFAVAYINNTGKTLTNINVFDKNFKLIYTSGLVINPILEFIN